MRIHQRGLTMVELLIALAISSFIIIGTVFVYSQSRNTYALNDSQARLQEYGRYAVSVLEPDLQLAGYFGFSNNPADLRFHDSTGDYSVATLEQSDPAIITAPAAIHSCGNNYVLDLQMSLQGTNASYNDDATQAPKADCVPNGNYVAGTDTLTLRRASTTSTKVPLGTLIQLHVNAVKRSNQYIFNSSTAPDVIDDMRELRNLVVRKYYISDTSDGRPNVPSLRRKYLTTDGTKPVFKDEEILPSVEDMQIEFGIDDGNHDGVAGIDKDDNNNNVPDNPNGVISRWVNTDDNALKRPPTGVSAQVVAVRVWLRIRADAPETGYQDTRTYNYADVKDWTPSGADATYRRVLVSRTIFLRNARTL